MKVYCLASLAAAALLALLALLAFNVQAWAQEDEVAIAETVSIEDLINNMAEYDGQEVVIEGEAIGDVMRRGSHAWITVNDDAYSERSIEEGAGFAGYSNIGIGVWLEAGEAEPIRHLGSYKTRGDMVKVYGTFHRACAEHGEGTDIHATRLMVVESGHEIRHPFDWSKLLLVLILSMACAALWLLRLRNIRKARAED